MTVQDKLSFPTNESLDIAPFLKLKKKKKKNLAESKERH